MSNVHAFLAACSGSKASMLASGSEDSSVRLWCLARGTLLRVLPQDEAVTCLTQAGPDLLLFGDRMGKLSFLDLGSRETTHLLPNILVGKFRTMRLRFREFRTPFAANFKLGVIGLVDYGL